MERKIIIMLFLLVSCYSENKEANNKKEVGKNMNKILENRKYMTFDEFNEKYSYWDDNNERNYGYSIESEDKNILGKYINYKEKNLKKYIPLYKDNVFNIPFENMNEEEAVIQLVKIIVEVYKKGLPELLDNSNMGKRISFIPGFTSEIETYIYKLKSEKRKFYELLENNFKKEDIEIMLKILTYNVEFENYMVEEKYNLKKVDEILNELEKVEGLTEQQWIEIESNSIGPLFENEVNNIFGFLYLLNDNRIMIVNRNEETKKEIKVKDYKKTEAALYKDIIYIRDDNKIYEYSLDNLEIIKIIDLEKENII